MLFIQSHEKDCFLDLMFSLSQVHYCSKIGIFFSIPFRFSLYLLSLDWYGVESDETGVEESGLGDEEYQSFHDGNSDENIDYLSCHDITIVTKANSTTRKGKHAAKMYPGDDNESPLSLQKKKKIAR